MTIILIAGLILIFISPIPFLAGAVGESLKYIASVFTSAASSISHLRGITVSLKYDFVPYIIIPLVLVLMIFLVIKLKRKWIMFVPPLLSVMAFVIALNTYNVKNTDQFDVIYLKDKRSDMLIVSTIDETSICDISTGGYANLYLACNESESFEYLTEIENFIITHYHNYHVSSLEKICNKYMIRNVYLPLAENEEDAQAQSKIIEALKPTGTKVKLYKKGSSIKDSNGNAITVSENAYVDRSSHPVFTICVSGGAKSFVYATSSAFEIDNIKPALQVDVLIIGSHGPTIKSFSENEFLSNYFESVPHMIVFSSPNEMLDNQDAISYINYLYQKGHKIIIDGKNYYRFKLD